METPPIYVSTNDQNVEFGNMLAKGKYLIKEGDDVCFITDISGTEAWNDCCALEFLNAIQWF